MYTAYYIKMIYVVISYQSVLTFWDWFKHIVSSQVPMEQVYHDIAAAMEQHNAIIATTTDPDKRKMFIDEVQKVWSY